MTQKQIDTLKELGFIQLHGNWIKVFHPYILKELVVIVDEKEIAISAIVNQTSHPFTLTKLREIVSKLEKL